MNFIIDIDGTLTIPGARLECLQRTPPNWDEFYDRCGEDAPNRPIVEIVRKLMAPMNPMGRIWFATGRRESCRVATKKWLSEHFLSYYHALLMRKDGDFRHDTIVKPELVAAAGLTPENVTAIFEDRASMCQKWRELGFTCLQVADGNF